MALPSSAAAPPAPAEVPSAAAAVTSNPDPAVAVPALESCSHLEQHQAKARRAASPRRLPPARSASVACAPRWWRPIPERARRRRPVLHDGGLPSCGELVDGGLSSRCVLGRPWSSPMRSMGIPSRRERLWWSNGDHSRKDKAPQR
jgi:hypothetical protein